MDNYTRVAAQGNFVVVRRFVPETPTFAQTDKQRRFGDIRHKAWIARERGAKALIVVDWPEPPSPSVSGWKPPPEAHLPSPSPEGRGDAGLPVLVVKRSAIEPLLAKVSAGKKVEAKLKVALTAEKSEAFNVLGLLRVPLGLPPRS